MEIKNLKKIMMVLGLLAVALVMRLAYIQLVGHDELSAATRAQSLISLEGSNTRGIIYDRYGAALVADEKSYVYIISRNNYTKKAETLLKKAGAELIDSSDGEHYVYSSVGYDKETGRELMEGCGAYILQASSRYGRQQPAAHLIGYVNKSDSSGAAGLELMFDDRLAALERKVYAAADVTGSIIPGRGLIIASEAKEDSYAQEGIRTTIDRELQLKVEEIIGAREKNCAVVILDVRTGGVVAMACTPGFDPKQADKYVRSEGNELVNKATQGEYPPGSIFKLVVAAAALERGEDHGRTYVCSGSTELSDMSIRCDTGGNEGHGEISFEDALAQSCNSYFIQLAQETGADEIIDMAYDMGLGRKALEGFPQESAGHLMTERERGGNAIGNLAIGQGETLVTPLQVAAMTNVIAAGGVDKGVHILMHDEAKNDRIISQDTAEIIGDMMTLVTEEGTGGIIGKGFDGKPEAAVKTGTAEYGAKEKNMTHGWMTGFTPCDEPEYTITVLVENGTSGALSAGPVFAEIMEYLEESGSYSTPTLT